CSCCLRHELAIKAMQQQMLDEVNSLRKLLQMQPFETIYSCFLSTPASTAASCPSVVAAPTRPALEFMPLRPTLGSMPPEILDRIVSFVSGVDILQLCHAVRDFKHISKAMFEFARALKKPPKPVDLWPRINVRHIRKWIAAAHLPALGAYSRILSKHGGYAIMDDSRGMGAVLIALPEARVDNNTRELNIADNFFSKMFTKKIIRELTVGMYWSERCKLTRRRATC
ncbi:hypothetical protein HDU81_007563, partial [Chytriomyces hyalinus]